MNNQATSYYSPEYRKIVRIPMNGGHLWIYGDRLIPAGYEAMAIGYYGA